MAAFAPTQTISVRIVPTANTRSRAIIRMANRRSESSVRMAVVSWMRVRHVQTLACDPRRTEAPAGSRSGCFREESRKSKARRVCHNELAPCRSARAPPRGLRTSHRMKQSSLAQLCASLPCTLVSLAFVVAPAVNILTAWSNGGYIHPDQHWQILEFAWYKLGHQPAS